MNDSYGAKVLNFIEKFEHRLASRYKTSHHKLTHLTIPFRHPEAQDWFGNLDRIPQTPWDRVPISSRSAPIIQQSEILFGDSIELRMTDGVRIWWELHRLDDTKTMLERVLDDDLI